jgi:hypothetical protein
MNARPVYGPFWTAEEALFAEDDLDFTLEFVEPPTEDR